MKAFAVGLVWLIGGGCGRIDYDLLAAVGDEDAAVPGDAGGPAVDAPIRDDARADALPSVTTLTFGEGPLADVSGVTADTLLNDGTEEALNFGVRDYLDAGPDEAGLLRFDLTSVSPVTEVVSATLRLWLFAEHTGEGSVSVYEVLEAWEEGTEDGAPGAANWNERLDGVAWTTPGVGPGSRDSTPVHTFSPVSVAAYDVPLPAALVQRWVASPETNHGVLLTGTGYTPVFEEHPHFVTSEHTTADRRPLLTLELVSGP